jgi:hypothetical protein
MFLCIVKLCEIMVYNDDIAIPFNQGDSMSIKISIIGAGSAVFSLNMIRDLCLTPNLQGSTVCFMDVNEERLNAAYALCSRYAQEVGIKLNLEKTTDRKKALKGANYVINSALVGGHHRLRAGWEIGKKYGYRHGGSLHFSTSCLNRSFRTCWRSAHRHGIYRLPTRCFLESPCLGESTPRRK